MNRLFVKLGAAGLVVLASGAVGYAQQLGPAFTYQGQLKQNGSPVNGSRDFNFRLFDAETFGNFIAGPVWVNNVQVTNGLFTVQIDIGAGAFNGQERWLEVEVNGNALWPRQRLTATPYARFAANAAAAPWSGLTGIPAGFADGIDNGGGSGHSLDAADGSPANAVFVDNAGNVGIGTTTPEANLHLRTAGQGVRIQGSSGGVDNGAYLAFANGTGTDIGYVGDGSSGDNSMYVVSYIGDVHLYTPVGAALTAKASGNVGIGTTDPIGGLHVKAEPFTYGGTLTLEGTTSTYIAFFPDGAAGGRKGYLGFPGADINDIYITNEIPGGSITLAPGPGGVTRTSVLEITGADLAEKFPASERVEPGMVVAIDPQNPGKMCLARGAYNRCVAGVVSGANDFSAGAVLGNLPGCEDAPAVALSGRVYVQCDASIAPILPGDLLTTSDTPGYAMKAVDPARAQGAVLGKAMTELRDGRGLVLVLVTLQ